LSYQDILKSFEDICESISRQRFIDKADEERIRESFGERADKALALVREKKVKKCVFKPSCVARWIVTGKEGKDHLVLPSSNYCSCEDFFFQVLASKVPACSHIIARRLGEALNSYEVVEQDEQLYYRVLDNK
jgi:predicted nucleic acid-binding Zn finger protein